jgi:hypothetical protein
MTVSKQEATMPEIEFSKQEIKTPYGTFTVGQLREAFTKVENKENWKKPISSSIPVEECDVTSAAIEFFTGGKTSFSPRTAGKVWVSSPGYYNTVGA